MLLRQAYPDYTDRVIWSGLNLDLCFGTRRIPKQSRVVVENRIWINKGHLPYTDGQWVVLATEGSRVLRYHVAHAIQRFHGAMRLGDHDLGCFGGQVLVNVRDLDFLTHPGKSLARVNSSQ